jgi:hypothetical protein
MKIDFTAAEKKEVRKLQLPKGTTLYQSSKKGDAMYFFKVDENGEWIKTKDFIEDERPWKEGEREEFLKGMSKDRLVNFFTCKDGDAPRREYGEYSTLQYTYFKNITFGNNAFVDYDDFSTKYNTFTLKVYRNDNVGRAARDLQFVLRRLQKKYPNIDKFNIYIMENTLSEHTSWNMDWHVSGKFVLKEGRYSITDDVTFTKASDLIKHMQKDCWYD